MIWNWIWCNKGHSNLLKKWMKINWIINSSCLFCFDIGSNLTETAELRRLGSWPAENRWVHDWFYARSFSVIKWRIFFFGKLEEHCWKQNDCEEDAKGDDEVLEDPSRNILGKSEFWYVCITRRNFFLGKIFM